MNARRSTFAGLVLTALGVAAAVLAAIVSPSSGAPPKEYVQLPGRALWIDVTSPDVEWAVRQERFDPILIKFSRQEMLDEYPGVDMSLSVADYALDRRGAYRVYQLEHFLHSMRGPFEGVPLAECIRIAESSDEGRFVKLTSPDLPLGEGHDCVTLVSTKHRIVVVSVKHFRSFEEAERWHDTKLRTAPPRD